MWAEVCGISFCVALGALLTGWAVRRIPRSSDISKADALEIAKREVAGRGWPWREPVIVKKRFRTYLVWTAADWKGGNITIDIDRSTGHVKRIDIIQR